MPDSDWDEGYEQAPTVTQITPPFRAQPRDEYRQTSRASRYDNEASNSKTFQIESKYVGKIIGKGGANIKELRYQTNTNILIQDNVADPNMAQITIKGAMDDIASAHAKIMSFAQEMQTQNRPRRFTESRDRSSEYDSSRPRERENKYLKNGKIDWGMIAKSSKEKEEEIMRSLPPIQKIFYQEMSHIAELSEEDVEHIRISKNAISVRDMTNANRPVPKIVSSFSDVFSPFPEILESINSAGFSEPSPIQCQAWPIIMSGHDLIGIAQTGTGKTLAFLMPALLHIEHQPVPRHQRSGPTCLILSPTRELAQQIHEEVLKFNYRNIKSVCVYGGGSRSDQIGYIEDGAEIVIATPGRLNDLIDSGVLSVTNVTFLVLDEADRMLDLGFEPDIRKVIILIRKDRQTIMTSATWPPGVSRMANTYLTDPFQINVGSLNLTACKNVEQRVEMISQEDKLERLKSLMVEYPSDYKILIFVGRKITADYLAVEFTTNRICEEQVQCIHGGREQCDRERALSQFKTGEVRILIATDVASRGLDVSDINLVINYDFPKNIEEYVHRIGRTGRAGKFGTSLSFFTRENWGSAQPLIDILTESNQVVPDELVMMARRFKEKRAERDAQGFRNDNFNRRNDSSQGEYRHRPRSRY
ncbi:putative ATP-dependent RNA helicase DDX43 [Thelohanellus kitauei]|uniref:RNA helicase n=1 Tax=Thelohanellus kitauei TaxID=669202 RepID=A0A0C2MQK8_THEKT|nr:putative ATP-dependent RNA helicase DDX43 [Thelohanellus kitauei]